jgi:hypothetical protein
MPSAWLIGWSHHLSSCPSCPPCDVFCSAEPRPKPRPRHIREDTKDTKISGESAGDRPAKGSGEGPKANAEQLARENTQERTQVEVETQDQPQRRYRASAPPWAKVAPPYRGFGGVPCPVSKQKICKNLQGGHLRKDNAPHDDTSHGITRCVTLFRDLVSEGFSREVG